MMSAKGLGGLILVIAIVGLSLSMGVLKLAIIPGFEGLDAGIEGVDIKGSFYDLGAPLPQSTLYIYEWGDATPRSTVLRSRVGPVGDWGGVRVEVGRPQTINDPYSSPKTVDYWVKDGASYIHVKGEIMVYSIPVTFSVRREGGVLQYIFQGERVWVGLTSVAWNQAVQEQSPYSGELGYGTAWEGPLATIITSYGVLDKGEHYFLEPSEQGRDFVLYDTHAQSGVISDLGWEGDLNASLAGDLRPDTRLTQTAFFSITMSDFGLTSGVWWSNAPVANYVLKVYTLRIGEYTYTNPDDTPWGDRLPEGDGNFWENFLSGFTAMFNNPLFWVVGIAFIAFVVLFLGTGPKLIGMLGGRER